MACATLLTRLPYTSIKLSLFYSDKLLKYYERYILCVIDFLIVEEFQPNPKPIKKKKALVLFILKDYGTYAITG
jgi:hypothetical protein